MGTRHLVAAVLLGLLQLVVLVTLAAAGPSETPHHAPLAIVAPPVVATALVQQADAVADQPMRAHAVTTAAQARRGVRDGRDVGAVVVDLRRQKDVLYLAGANGDDLDRAVRRTVRAVESSMGRTVEVRDLVPVRRGDTDARGVYAITGVCVLLGFVATVVVTWVRGPVAATLRLGVVRFGVFAAVAAVAGIAVAAWGGHRYGGASPAWWLLGTLTVLATAAVAMALESVFGVIGLGVAATVSILSAAPLAWLTHPTMLHEPWATITPWLPHGASLSAARGEAYFGGPGARPVLVLGAWIVLSVLTLLAARRERPTAAEVRADRGRTRPGRGA